MLYEQIEWVSNLTAQIKLLHIFKPKGASRLFEKKNPNSHKQNS